MHNKVHSKTEQVALLWATRHYMSDEWQVRTAERRLRSTPDVSSLPRDHHLWLSWALSVSAVELILAVGDSSRSRRAYAYHAALPRAQQNDNPENASRSGNFTRLFTNDKGSISDFMEWKIPCDRCLPIFISDIRSLGRYGRWAHNRYKIQDI